VHFMRKRKNYAENVRQISIKNVYFMLSQRTPTATYGQPSPPLVVNTVPTV